MNEFIEMLKLRQQASQTRFQVAQQKLAAAQAEAQSAQQEFNSWNYALAMEQHRIQLEEAAEAAKQEGPPVPASAPVAPIANVPEVNKTELVRGVLRQHPTGITPIEIWKEVKDQIDSAYIYSVLKRLKDREEVSKKRGKYYLKHPQSQPEEVAAQNGVIEN